MPKVRVLQIDSFLWGWKKKATYGQRNLMILCNFKTLENVFLRVLSPWSMCASPTNSERS